MGAVNYGTSDYITLGYHLTGEDNEIIMDYMREQVENLLNELNTYYFRLVVKSGYYEGFYLDIENNFPVAFDWYEEKRDAMKEITQIKKALLQAVKLCNIVQCFPGWCTGYDTVPDTIAAIRKAVNDMRDDVRTTPTWMQYNKEV